MKTYTTVQGDMFDGIAHKTLGDVKYKDIVMRANPKHIGTYIFPGGIKLMIPDVDESVSDADLPPWKQVAG